MSELKPCLCGNGPCIVQEGATLIGRYCTREQELVLVTDDRDIARKESAALAQLLEQAKRLIAEYREQTGCPLCKTAEATLAALQQRCAQWQSEAESNAGLLLDTRKAGERLVASIDSIRTMLYGLALDLRQAAIA